MYFSEHCMLVQMSVADISEEHRREDPSMAMVHPRHHGPFPKFRGKQLLRQRGRGRRFNGLSIDLNNNEGRQEKERNSGRKDPIYVEPCDSPRDVNGNIASTTLKIEMERRDFGTFDRDVIASRMNALMAYYESELRKVAHSFGLQIVGEEEVQIISEGRRYVVPFQVVCSNWQRTLTKFIHQFFISIKRNRSYSFFRHEMPMITTHSLLLYPLRLLNVHDNLPLSHLRFGSLLNNGRLGIHWMMAGGPLYREDWMNGFTFHKGIYASFEYDKRMITIEYCNREPDMEKRGRYNDVRGRVVIEMPTIHRIFFNQNCDGGIHEQMAVVLLLDAPPKLQVQRRNFDGTKESPSNSPWEYRAELNRGLFPGERSDRITLHDSKAILLEFDVDAIKEKLYGRNSSIHAFFYDLLSRLRHKTGRMIEYSSFDQIFQLKGMVRLTWFDRRTLFNRAVDNILPVTPYDVTPPFFDETVCRYIFDAAARLILRTGVVNGPALKDLFDYHLKLKVFRLRVLLSGILDRGMEYRIELLCSRKIWYNFVATTADRYMRDEERTLHTLERLLCLITEGRVNCSIHDRFEKEWALSTVSTRSALFSEQERKEGYWRIMKLVATPTRLIFVGYEVIMGNRVLNKYAVNENHIIRLSFREDRGGPLRRSAYPPEVQARFRRMLVDGVNYAGRHFLWLGNSNSQLREQGCYMMHVDPTDRGSLRLTPHEVRRQMGDFHQLPNIPKMIARLGQVFTQCKPSMSTLYPIEVGTTYDLTGGKDPSGKQFVFSDGVGLISAEHAEKLSKEHGLKSTASTFQIRFRGEKGLLCVDPLLDERNEVLKMCGRQWESKKVLVRPSMSKFEVKMEHQCNLDIVKFSFSSAVFLNRPLINILCQVSDGQSASCHRRVTGRVQQLMDTMMREILQSLYVEKKAYEAIRELSFPFSIEVLNETSGISFTTEPFFRSLLRANVRYVMQRQLYKMNIRIPATSGRLMFGVVDTSGILQYGQIFCQYSGSVSKQGWKVRSVSGIGGIVHTGPVMITKNPCISSGDVRMFDAVDIPALRHLVDVVVFPMHGPRPHPDEMAGSDLDGDEYTVIWDEELFFERNEEASIFPFGDERNKWAIPRRTNGSVDFYRCEQRKADFYTEAIVHGHPGMLCSAHLAISDLYGLNSKTAISLAGKIAQTLDYQKSGIQPEEMTIFTVDDPDDSSRLIPAEKTQLKPDFLKNYREPAYESRGILGIVFREAGKYEDALDSVEEETEKIKLDPAFLIPGCDRFREEVEAELANYSHAMKNVFEHYGIATEKELLSGMIISVKNRLSDKEDEDGTLFTTNRIIEGKVKRIIETAREHFFENLLDWRNDLEEIENKRNDVRADSILNRRVKAYTHNLEGIRRKAAAAYNVAYIAASRSVRRGEQSCILLSFPWIMYDVLIDIKTRPDDRIVRVLPADPSENSKEPLAQILSDVIDEYCENPSNTLRLDEFMERFGSGESIVARSLRENEGLGRTAFVMIEWARHVGGMNTRFTVEHLLSLFIIFGLGEVTTYGIKRRFLRKPRGDKRDHPKKGEHLLLFIDYLSSREFRTLPTLSFAEVGGGALMRGEWKTFSEICLPSFLSLVTTHRLDLPMEGGNTAKTTTLREYEPRVMQLPERVIIEELDEVRDALRTVSGCASVNLRKITKNNVIVSALGRSEQLRVLTKFIHPPAPPRERANLKGMIESMTIFTYTRLMNAAKMMTAV